MNHAKLEVDDILDRYNLTRDTAARYIDAIVRMKQSQAADGVEVSHQTINRYKNVFEKMSEPERLIVISSLAHEILLKHIETGGRI